MKTLNFMRYIKALVLAILFNVTISTSILACDTAIILAAADNITLDQAINEIKNNNKGKILDAKTRQIDGQPVHEIKVLTPKGHVKKIRIQTKQNQH